MTTALPKRLEEVLGAIVDQHLASRLRRVHEAVAHAIEQLASVNLVQLEPSDEGSADLSLWELMAPAIRDTVLQVNTVCDLIEEEFPEHITRSGVFSAESSDERAEAESALVFRAVALHLKKDVAKVGSLLRRPELVAAPWLLLGELQRIREEFRKRVGDAVYLTAAANAVVRREEVVPGALKEVQRALLYRSSVADLRRSVRARLEGVQTLKTAQALLTDFELFTTMPSWRYVRAESKARMLAVKRDLKKRIGQGSVGEHPSLAALVEPLMTGLSEFSAEVTLVMLASHDRMIWAELVDKLEQVLLHVHLDTQGASLPLAAAATTAEKLHGRDDKFDHFLSLFRREPVDEMPHGRVVAVFEMFREQLRALRID